MVYLIVAPKGVYKNWHDGEIPTHLPDHIDQTSVLWQPFDLIRNNKKN